MALAPAVDTRRLAMEGSVQGLLCQTLLQGVEAGTEHGTRPKIVELSIDIYALC